MLHKGCRSNAEQAKTRIKLLRLRRQALNLNTMLL